jgi:transposase
MTMPHASQLLAEVESLRSENQRLQQENERLAQLNHVLQLKVDAMARKLFGQSSEKLDPAQMQLVFDALHTEAADAAKKPAASGSNGDDSEADLEAAAAAEAGKSEGKRKKRSLEQLVAGLPVTEVIVDPQEVRDNPQGWVCMGAEETRLIDYTPGKFSCQKIIRRKWVRKDSRHLPPVIAPLHLLQERCMATPRLLAHVATSHYELHLPYYRIEKMSGREGLELSRQTQCGWMGMAARSAGLVVREVEREVFADGYVQIDETPVKYQDPRREGVCGTGYLWAVHNPVRNITLFAWHTGRGSACLEKLVPAGWRGIIQCDGFAAYETFANSPGRHGSIRLAGCMAHARRKFFEAQAEGEDSRWVLARMQQLYRIEERLRQARAGPEEVLQTRQKESRPIIEKIQQRLEALATSGKHFPRSLTGGAIRYALAQWGKLCVFIEDGRVQLDNNLIENAIRPSAIGKKNWLFIGDPDAGHRTAVFYTLIANCQREGINAQAYLTDLFARLPTATNRTVHQLTPKAWAAEQRARRQMETVAATVTAAAVV